MRRGDRRLGVHTSIAGGVPLALERAERLRCSTVQIFSHNPRIWNVMPMPDGAGAKFREMKEALDIRPVYIHTSYLINLASANMDVREKSISLLIKEMDIADSLGAEYVVLHTGSASGEDEDIARGRAAEALGVVARAGKWESALLLENTAGERGDISSRIADLAEIIGKTASPLIGGICLDTCHAFQSGYELTSEEGVAGLAAEIKHHLGPGMVKLIHLNDSKRAFNSRVDRHEHIGMGTIGKEGLRGFLHHPDFCEIPLILETPKKSDDDDPRNLKIVRTLLRKPA